MYLFIHPSFLIPYSTDIHTCVTEIFVANAYRVQKKKTLSGEGHDVSQFKTTSGHEQTEDTYPIPGGV